MESAARQVYTDTPEQLAALWDVSKGTSVIVSCEWVGVPLGKGNPVPFKPFMVKLEKLPKPSKRAKTAH